MDKLEQKQECGGCQEAHLITEMKEWFYPITPAYSIYDM